MYLINKDETEHTGQVEDYFALISLTHSIFLLLLSTPILVYSFFHIYPYCGGIKVLFDTLWFT